MKTIVLIRHAKSSRKNSDLKDIERPLKKKGLSDAPLMGKVLKQHQLIPDLIISSPAVRALDTAKIFAHELGFSENHIVTEPNLYLESKSKLLKTINAIDDKFETVFLVGHNPGLTDLANLLTGEKIEDMPTGGMFGMQLECNTWAEVNKGNVKRKFLEVPKEHNKKEIIN